ncbi:MAG: PilZ domain-containing protein [Oceanococcaceae bacterium]
MGPSYVSRRPVRFVRGAEAGSAADALRVLLAVGTLEHHDSATRVDGGDGPSPEWQDVRARLDLLVALVGHLYRQQVASALPPRREVTIAADHMEWVADDLNSLDAAQAYDGVLELHLSDSYPEPLRLAGQLRIVAQTGPDTRLLSFRPLPLDPDVDDALRRQVFRHHRREIARKHGS